MEEKFIIEIKKYLIAKSNEYFNFAGVAETDNFILINTGKEKNITIKILVED